MKSLWKNLEHQSGYAMAKLEQELEDIKREVKSEEYKLGYVTAKEEREIEDLKQEILELDEDIACCRRENEEISQKRKELEKLKAAGVRSLSPKELVKAKKKLAKLEEEIALWKEIKDDIRSDVVNQFQERINQRVKGGLEKNHAISKRLDRELSVAQDRLSQAMECMIQELHNKITALGQNMYFALGTITECVGGLPIPNDVNFIKDKKEIDAFICACKRELAANEYLQIDTTFNTIFSKITEIYNERYSQE